MVRTMSQTPDDYRPNLQTEQWETPLVEITLDVSEAVDDSAQVWAGRMLGRSNAA